MFSFVFSDFLFITTKKFILFNCSINMKNTIISKLISVLFVFQTITISAQEFTQDSLVHERIQCIQNMLSQSKPIVNRWWYGWLGVYSAATIGQGTVFLLSNDIYTKQDMALGSATTLIGVVGQLFMPLNTGRDAEILAKLSENSADEQLIKLSKAEELLKSNAMKEKVGRSWQIHALNEAANLSNGLIMWLGYKRSVWDGLSNFLLNSIVTETQIWTQPTQSLKDYRNYCKKYKYATNSRASIIQPEYYLKTYPGGIALTIIF